MEQGRLNDNLIFISSKKGLRLVLSDQRDVLTNQMITLLEGAQFNNQPIDAMQVQQLIDQGNALLQQVSNLAANA